MYKRKNILTLDKPDEQCDSLLKLGVFYSNQSDVWWWLAEQILLKAVNCITFYNLDGGKRHALSRYLYGRYLLLQGNNYS